VSFSAEAVRWTYQLTFNTGNMLGLPVVAGLLAGVLLREAQLRRNVTLQLPMAKASRA
jgi:hypothetical protein